MKSLTDKIREAKTWQERAKLARNEQPGTAFDHFFVAAQKTKEFQKVAPGLTRQNLEGLGVELANIILAGDSQTLHQMADALNIWKRHKPKPDHALDALFSLTGMFPPGWKETWGVVQYPKRKRVSPPPSATARDKVALRDIKTSLLKRNPAMTEEAWLNERRKIQRYAKAFGIPLDRSAGRPAGDLRHNRGRKVR
jgi:hypothetical protein